MNLNWTMYSSGIDMATDFENHHIYFRIETGTGDAEMAPLVRNAQDAAILVTVLQRYIHDCQESGDHWRLEPGHLEIDGTLEVWDNEYPAIERLVRP